MDLEDFPDDYIDIIRSKIGESRTTSAAPLGRDSSDAFTSLGDLQGGFEAQFPPLVEIESLWSCANSRVRCNKKSSADIVAMINVYPLDRLDVELFELPDCKIFHLDEGPLIG